MSRGRVSIRTSTDPVGAPIFYRDVPLMPSDGEKGVIKPLDQKLVPLIAWRLRERRRDGEPRRDDRASTPAPTATRSRATARRWGWTSTGRATTRACMPCSRSGRRPTIRAENVIEWSTFRGKLGRQAARSAFMSQVSPDGRYVVTTINDPGTGPDRLRAAPGPAGPAVELLRRELQGLPLPAGVLPDPRRPGVVQQGDGPCCSRCPAPTTRATCTPTRPGAPTGGSSSSPAPRRGTRTRRGRPLAERANDPNETQIRYDLYRIPFNDGRGGDGGADRRRVGQRHEQQLPEDLADGRFVVFVQARNGQLMRPDGQLYIVPVEGGRPRRMRATRR